MTLTKRRKETTAGEDMLEGTLMYCRQECKQGQPFYYPTRAVGNKIEIPHDIKDNHHIVQQSYYQLYMQVGNQ